MLGFFAGVAAVLAAIGLYGVLSYAVRERRPELAPRMAMGATSRDIHGMVLARGLGLGLGLTILGIGVGVIVALFLSRGISALLFEVSPADPLTYLVIAVALAMVAATASLVPARRASSVDPLAALREE